MIKCKNLISILLVVLINTITLAQDWPVTYSFRENTSAQDFIIDYDNGYVFVGVEYPDSTIRHGSAFIIKTDVNGEMLWRKYFGRPENYLTYINDVKKTADNGYLLTGGTDIRKLENWNPFFIKLNSCGDMDWCTILECEIDSSYYHSVESVILEDGSIISLLNLIGSQAVGYHKSLVKMDEYGMPLWVKQYEYTDTSVYFEQGHHLRKTADSNLLIDGEENVFEPYLLKTDNKGETIWNLDWSLPIGEGNNILQTVQDANGNYYSTGAIKESNLVYRPVLYKTTHDGMQVFHKYIFGDTIPKGGLGPIKLYNGNLLYCAASWSTEVLPLQLGHNSVIMCDTLGNILYMKNLDDRFVLPLGLEFTYDNKIAVMSTVNFPGKEKFYLYKLNMNLEYAPLNTQQLTYDSLCDHEILSDTLDLDCDVFVNIDELPTQSEYENPIKLWPNPASSKVNIKVEKCAAHKIKIYNSLGQMVSETKLSLDASVVIDVKDWNKGIYIIYLVDKKANAYARKLIVN
ncbi:MAG: hypothetical protein C0595_02795 [Marinilabiliales bacterium]|nr:MAG: hypothetical protein C0595_02795 [Marinilabiliales bacterium]